MTKVAGGYDKNNDLGMTATASGRQASRADQTSLLCLSAAAIKLANKGWGSKGFDFSSG